MSQNKSRYGQMRRNMSFILIGDLLFFILYLLGAGNGVVWLKVLCAVITLLASALILCYLYLTQELFRKRSLWMTVAAGAIAFCVLYSLVLNFPSPAPTPENILMDF